MNLPGRVGEWQCLGHDCCRLDEATIGISGEFPVVANLGQMAQARKTTLQQEPSAARHVRPTKRRRPEASSADLGSVRELY